MEGHGGIRHTNSRVRIRNKLTEAFDITEALRQGDPLSTLLFNLIHEAAVRTMAMDTSNTIFTKSSQLLGFADDLDVIGRNVDVVKDNFVYRGSQVNSKNDIVDEIRRRVTLGNRCYFGLLNLLRSKGFRRNLKCMLYKTLIRPVACCYIRSC